MTDIIDRIPNLPPVKYNLPTIFFVNIICPSVKENIEVILLFSYNGFRQGEDISVNTTSVIFAVHTINR